MGSRCCFPDDIIEDIVGRLPGRSLVRFKCVSKGWCYLISSFKFKPRALLCSARYCQFFHSINDDESVFEELPTPWPSAKITPALYPGRQFKGLVNGLLLIQIGGDSYFLWNPFTGYFNNVLNGWYLGDNIGFCYDPCTDDYKLVAFGSKFIVIKRVKFSYDITLETNGPVVEGRLHWSVVYKKDISEGTDILCFDPTTDELAVLPTRKPKHGNMDLLGVLKGNLCMFCNCMQSHFEVTVMKEYGVVESWTTLFVISNLQPPITPLSFTRDGELLMTIRYGKIVAYNPTYTSYRQIDFLTNLRPGPEPRGFSNFVATYEPTLVSPFLIKQKRKKKKKNIDCRDSANEEELNEVQEQAGKQELESSMIEQIKGLIVHVKMVIWKLLNRLRKSRMPVPEQAWTKDYTMGRKGF